MKAVELVDFGRPVMALLVAGAVAAMLVSVRAGAGALFAVTVPLAVGTGHSFLLCAVALLVALFPDAGRRHLAYRTQLVALYLFTGAAKVNAAWLSGLPLARKLAVDLPGDLVVLAAWVVVVTELWMALAVWKAPTFALPVGVALHVGIVLGMEGSRLLPLLVFNGLALCLLWTVCRVKPAS